MKPRKDDVWLVDFGDPVGREQAGRRLVVVVSVNSLNGFHSPPMTEHASQM